MIQEKLIRLNAEKTIKSNFEATFKQRVDRFLEIKHHEIISNPTDTKFASVSTECIDLFRDGHFYGCISLVQTVAEALVKFLCIRNNFDPDKVFEKSLETLQKRTFIDEEVKKNFLAVWDKRNDYHHLNNSVESDRKKLEGIAKIKIQILAQIEKSIFDYSIVNGIIKPRSPKYWDVKNGTIEVFLRIEN